jgi:predicted amino acid-binding ACT domain protein
MKDHAIRIDYFPVTVDDRPGEGAKISAELKRRGINLLALHGFPTDKGKAQIDLVPEDSSALTSVARELGWTLGQKKTAFLIQGDDRVGAVAEIHDRLAQGGISLVAESAVSAGSGRYGCILWVDPKDVEKTATALDVGVRVS